MKKLLVLVTLVVALPTWAGLSFNAGVVSDYIWRGVSQSDKRPAIQGGVDWESNFGLSIGTWVSNVYIENATDTEQDIYAAYTYKLNDNLAVALGYTFYSYLDDATTHTSEYTVRFDVYGADINVNYTDDWFGTDTSSMYFNASYKYEFCPKAKMGVLVSIGYTTFDDEDKAEMKNFVDYKIGLEKTVDSYDFGLYYSDTNREDSAGTEQDDQSLFVALTKNF